jgi:tetratricopeptide (TPR) repeat protein
MLRRLASMGASLAVSVLVAGCGTTHPGGSGAALRHEEVQSEQEAQRRASAHAHYSAAVILEMNGETTEAGEEYLKAAALDPSDESLVLEVATKFLQAKQNDKALEVLNKAAGPSASGQIYARMAFAYSRSGKTEPAIAAARTAIKKSPDLLEGYRNLFLAYSQAKQPRAALQALDDAAARPVKDPAYLVDLAELYIGLSLEAPSLKDVTRSRSIAVLKRAEKLNPANPVVRLKLADGFNLAGETAEAAKLYVELQKRSPNLPGLSERLRANLADIYLRSNDHKLAAEQLEAILRDDPTVSQAYFFLGRIALEDKKPEVAAEHFKKLLLLTPNFEPAYYLLAMAQINTGKASDALQTLDKARNQFAQNFAMEFWTGMAYSREKSYNEALRHFTAAEVFAQATDPKQLDDGFYFQLGAVCERKGDYEQAEKYFEKSLRLAPDSSETMNYLGYMWAEHGMKLDRARDLIEKAVKAEPSNAAYLDSLAWVLYKLNKPKEALPQALKAIQLSEEPDPTVFDHLGDIYAALNEMAKAREAWQKSLSLEANDEVKKKLSPPDKAEPPAK